MGRIRIAADPEYSGEGISKGLARGLQVYYRDSNLTGEGMGIGAIALRDHHSTYFSRSWTDSGDPGTLMRTFTLDSRMTWCIRQKPSSLLTRLIEYGVRVYMRVPRAQIILLLPVFPFRTLLGIHPIFEPTTPRGTVSFSYRVTAETIEVQVSTNNPLHPGERLSVLNELCGRRFVAGWRAGHQIEPLPGWERIGRSDLPVSLIDPIDGIRFSLESLSIPASLPFSIFRGREYRGDLAWAGFCIQLGPLDTPGNIPCISYKIGFSGEES